MSAFRNIDVKSPHIQELQQTIQVELANRRYSSEDDPVMAEYIVVMLANQKTADQIRAELQDLVGGEYDASFTGWVWDATQQCLDNSDAAQVQQEGEASGSAAAAAATPAVRGARSTRRRRSRSPPSTRAAGRGGREEERTSRSPAATSSKREGAGRGSRSRSPSSLPWGRGAPRPRDYTDSDSFRKSTSLRRDDDKDFDGAAFWRQKAEEKRRNPPPSVVRHGPQQIFQAAYGRALRNSTNANANANGNGNGERQLFPDSSQRLPAYKSAPASAAGGVSIFGRAGIPDPRAPAFVPNASLAPSSASNGTSILARIDPMLPNNEPIPLPTTTITTSQHSSDFPTAPTETSTCRWNVGCTNPMCPYSHASPANAGPGGDPNALVLSQQNCRYGAGCTNKDCTRSHVSPAVAKISAHNPPPTAPSATATSTAGVLSMDTALPNGAGSRPCQRAADAQQHGGTSNRLQAFAGEDEEMEVIIPGAGASQQREGTAASSTVASTSPGVEA
ncbi:related to NAB2 - nuclear polyadenylated RNA-binding protein required for nuclear mRNA export [Ustilago bromivora]|uniref:Related to NAB2 - nuclear polyadenylated RNA-binding protein required for nuclear mRNA export n=1 Tax=Ustilago bromivora TaxID=307758 RepID=A0A8H8TQK6_9BASI|nr:related to NAB2 - nuclear polyadenylated RNA-binding protein required for nuclear mRNA export [Ustilago bromivora]